MEIWINRSCAELWRVTVDGSPYVHLNLHIEQGLYGSHRADWDGCL